MTHTAVRFWQGSPAVSSPNCKPTTDDGRCRITLWTAYLQIIDNDHDFVLSLGLEPLWPFEMARQDMVTVTNERRCMGGDSFLSEANISVGSCCGLTRLEV